MFCEYLTCQQYVKLNSSYCYYHGKLVNGLLEPSSEDDEWDENWLES